jgi:serine/threonine protein kinase
MASPHCGFPTRDGKPCTHSVKGSFRRCHQHQEIDVVPIRNLKHDSCQLHLKQYGSLKRQIIGSGVWGVVRSLCVKLRNAPKESCDQYVIKSINIKPLQNGIDRTVDREISAQEYMNSNGIGPILVDWWKCRQELYLVMERVGMNYHKLFEEQGNRFTDNDINCMFLLADALDDHKIIHGDLKPDNMTLCVDEKESSDHPAVAIDFGGVVSYEDVNDVKVFTAIPVMGWTRIPYPKKWVNNINRNTLACSLQSEPFNIAIDRLPKNTVTNLARLKQSIKQYLFNDQFALNAYYDKLDTKAHKQTFDALAEEDEEQEEEEQEQEEQEEEEQEK